MFSPIEFNVIPSLSNVLAAIIISFGLYLLIKLARMIKYEIKYGNGAGEYYLSNGKKATEEEFKK